MRTRLCLLTLALALAWPVVVSAEPIERHVRVGAVERSYLVDLPTRVRRPARAAGRCSSSMAAAARRSSARTQTRMSEKGQAEGFIAVYPQGSGVLVGQAPDLERDHLLRLRDAASHRRGRRSSRRCSTTSQASFAIDRSRVYATGISNGGMMAYLVGLRAGRSVRGDRGRRRRADGRRSAGRRGPVSVPRHPRHGGSEPSLRRR